MIEDINLDEIIEPNLIKKLSKTEANLIERPIKLEELSSALKRWKTSRVDGFSSEFVKMFWCKLKSFILKGSNYCYRKGKLSTTWRQCIINCVPKGDKPRQYLKNWHPISLLCVIYKLISTVISNCFRNVLDTLVSRTQTGFIQGRYIGESLCLFTFVTIAYIF